MPAPVLQFKRGNAGVAGTVPALRPGEPAISLNNFDFFIGIDTSVANNKFFGSHRYWGREDGSTSLRLKLVDKDGTNYVAIKTPDTLAGIVTYQLPGVQGGSGTVLTNDGSGNLTWGSGSSNPVFSGIATFTDTTDNTLGDPNTGAVQIDGGVGIEKNLTVGAGLSVAGQSYFIGTATFYGGTLNLGDSDTDNINVAGEFVSNLVPNADDTYDIGNGGASKRWRNASFAGVGTFARGAVIDSVQIGINTDVIETTSGKLTLTSATGVVEVTNRLDILGDLDVSGNVYIGGTTVTLRGTDVFIENKDIVLGYTTSIGPNDTTANHAGVAIASTEGSPLVSFSASGINTLPDTYKQLMWFRNGTLGFSTDAFAFNYGVAIGTTTMADGVRLAVGSGITMSDTAISATNFYGTFSGNSSSADQVKTVTASNTNSTYYVTFVDANNGSATNETVYTDDGIYYNPGTNTFTTQYGEFTGSIGIGTNSAAERIHVTGGNYNAVLVEAATEPSLVLRQPTSDTTGFTATLYNSYGNVGLSHDDRQLGQTTYIYNYDASDEATQFQAGGYDVLKIWGDTQNYRTVVIGDGQNGSLTRTGTFGQPLQVKGGAYVRDNLGIGYTNPTSKLSVDGDVLVSGVATATSFYGDLIGTATTASRANTIDVVGVATNQNYYITLVDSSGNSKGLGVDSELLYNPNTNTFTVGTGVGITQFSSSVSTGTSTSSVPTSSAVIDYVDSEIGSIDLTLGLSADSGGPSTVNTSQTLTISGTTGEIETSVSGQTVTVGLPDAVIVGTSLSAPTIKVATVQHSNGTQAATIDTSGNITASQNLTVSGNLYVNGSTTQVNTASITVEDRTIELGVVDGSAPSSTTTWDLGVLFNYHDGTAKKSALVWEQGDARFKLGSTVTDGGGTGNANPQITVSSFAALEISDLWINNSCTGGSQQVIGCVGSELQLQNITIDAGTF